MVMMFSMWCRFTISCLLLTPLSHFKAGNDNGSLVAFNLIKLKTADPVNSLIKCFWDDIHAMVTSQPRCDRLGWDWFCSSEATHSVSIHIVHMGRWKSLFRSLSMYTFRQIYHFENIAKRWVGQPSRVQSSRLIHWRSRIRTISFWNPWAS